MISRRRLLKNGAALAAAAPAFLRTADARQRRTTPEDARTRDRLQRAGRDAKRRILIKGGTVITMDPAAGNFARGDVLVEGARIVAIQPAIANPGQAIVVDASDTTVIPGFVDPHIHAWQGQLAGIIPNGNIVADDPRNYYTVMYRTLGPHYRPQDAYIGNLLTALTCLDAGITCFCDNSHNTRSAAHADAAVRALFDSGIRAVHAAGGLRFPDQPWDRQWPEDLYRIRKQYFSSNDQLVTLRLFSGGDINIRSLDIARDLDLWTSFDTARRSPLLPGLYAKGLLVGRETFNHGTAIPEENWRVIREHGAKIDLSPRGDSQFTYGGVERGMNALQDALDHGVRPGISSDVPAAYGIDMFAEMQILYFTQRSAAQFAKFSGHPKPPAAVTARDVLEFATLRGAECCALDHTCGTLTPGKDADIVLLRTDGFRLNAANNAIGAVVQNGRVGNVDTVFVAGQVRKWRGELVGHDLRKIRGMADESRRHLFTASGWKVDLLAD